MGRKKLNRGETQSVRLLKSDVAIAKKLFPELNANCLLEFYHSLLLHYVTVRGGGV